MPVAFVDPVTLEANCNGTWVPYLLCINCLCPKEAIDSVVPATLEALRRQRVLDECKHTAEIELS